jgi:hypothetical protein
VASRRSALTLAWWAAAGVAELTIAIVLLVYGYWWTIFGTAPATAVCAYFVLKERGAARA